MLEYIEKKFETLVSVVSVFLFTIFHEIWRFVWRCCNNLFALVLGFSNKPAFEKWYSDHRGGRIVRTNSVLHEKIVSKEPVDNFEKILESLKDSDMEESGNQSDGESLSASQGQYDSELPFRREPETPSKKEPRKLKIIKKEIVKPSVPSSVSPHSTEQTEPGESKDGVYNLRNEGDSGFLFSHQKITTGLMQDIKLMCLLFIENTSTWVTRRVHNAFVVLSNIGLAPLLAIEFYINYLIWLISFAWTIFLSFFWILRFAIGMPSWLRNLKDNFVASEKTKLDTRGKKEIMQSLGYPYEAYDVVTQDGYIIRIERLPRPESKNVLYFQHGVVDSAFVWLGFVDQIGTSLALRAFDLGYDVWAGTLRGCDGEYRSVKNMEKKDYWNFSVNEHAWEDIPAFLSQIRIIKEKEFNNPGENAVNAEDESNAFISKKRKKLSPKAYHLSVIAHSMGAMASLMYAVEWGRKAKDHGMDLLILLSPAGYHLTAPLMCKITGPIFSYLLEHFPNLFYSFRFPSELWRIFLTKMIEDFKHNYSLRNLLSLFTSKFVGGAKLEHPFTHAHGTTYNIFAGTSAGIFKHFWQNWNHQAFEAYDYGPALNTKNYGSSSPLNIMDNYDKIKIPTYFVMGLQDPLIEPMSIIKQYEAMHKHHPDNAYLKAFPKMGHIDFTLGETTRDGFFQISF
jgi:pimeloyl-ACP methyl ester carboxylesterase